jgi:5-methylcytosine-specific restriction endonuclease McrA
MKSEDLIRQNKESNRKVRQSIMAFNNYEATRKQYEDVFSYGDQGKSIRRAKHGSPCPICGRIMNYNSHWQNPEHPSIDHKHPKFLARHLALNTDNFWVICQACNHEKGNKTWPAYEFWLEDKYGINSRQYRAAIDHRPTKI